MAKLFQRVGVICFVITIFVIIHLLKSPKYSNELDEWYKQLNGQRQIYATEKLGMVQHSDNSDKHMAEFKRLQMEFNDLQSQNKKEIKESTHSVNRKIHRLDKNDGNLIKVEVDHGERKKQEQNLKELQDNKIRNKSKIILIYTDLHNNKEWYNLPKRLLKDYLKTTGCIHTNCRVSYDKNLIIVADAVIFHERNMPSEGALDLLSKPGYRPSSQRWIFFTSETPKNTEKSIIPLNRYFNWTMTYKLDSDIFLPYLQYRKLQEHEHRPDKNHNYAQSKKSTIAWLVGNCEFELRMEFVHALEQFTSVYVGGGCRDDFARQINCTRWCGIEELKIYKFYLSLENGICTDYITEKYWRYLELGLVPIVLGGANYSDPRLAIPGSFIDASKFDTIKDLAVYIEYLDNNDTAYNEYFRWKQKYKIWHPKQGDWPFESYFLCRICEMLGNNLPNKVYNKLNEFWDEYTDCEVPEQKLRKDLVPEGYSWESRARIEEEKARLNKVRVAKDFDEE